MALFSFSDLKSTLAPAADAADGSSKQQGISVFKYIDSKAFSISNIKDLAPNLPAPGEIFFLWSVKSFNTFSFILYIIETSGKIKELTLSTYNISRNVISALMVLIDKGDIEHLNIILSDASKSLFPRSYDLMTLEASKRPDRVSIAWCWNHSKIALMRTDTGHYILEGSGNFSDNSRHEQYILLNDPNIFAYRHNWIMNEIKR